MGRGYAWLDTGTHDSLLEASSFIATLQKRQGLQVASPEEIAHANGWISDEELLRLAAPLSKSHYGKYLQNLVRRVPSDMHVNETGLPGVIVLSPRVFSDERGFSSRALMNQFSQNSQNQTVDSLKIITASLRAES